MFVTARRATPIDRLVALRDDVKSSNESYRLRLRGPDDEISPRESRRDE